MFFNDIKELTKKLVSINSINGQPSGETEIADFIYEYIFNLPYFKKHPAYVFTQNLRNDALKRKNVFALLKGEGGHSTDTILCHGHVDTVDLEGMGSLAKYAFDSDKLAAALNKINLSDELRVDLESGDYLFGRGSADMKSGDAVFIVLLSYLSERVKNINGNILFMFNPVEETCHKGVIDALEKVEELQRTENLHIIFAINNDYICPLYPGDRKKYIYVGTVGKILPSFYILGRETHVGQCFEGIDPSGIAARLVQRINLSPDLCDVYHEEYTLPPAVLKMKDLKSHYNVQTAQSAFIYFNYMVHNSEISDILSNLKKLAYESIETALQEQNNKFRLFCEKTGASYRPIEAKPRVLTYEELIILAKKIGITDIEQELTDIARTGLHNREDEREIALHLVEELCARLRLIGPIIVLFLCAPYCPHNTLHLEQKSEKKLYDTIKSIVDDVGSEWGETYEVLQFFPSLSDSSYFKVDDSAQSLQDLQQNFPGGKILYPLPFKTIRSLNIPALNYGCYGKDAHKWSERVYMPYSYDVLPKLLLKTFQTFLAV